MVIALYHRELFPLIRQIHPDHKGESPLRVYDEEAEQDQKSQLDSGDQKMQDIQKNRDRQTVLLNGSEPGAGISGSAQPEYEQEQTGKQHHAKTEENILAEAPAQTPVEAA
jgi:hypothetical protein